MILSQLARHRRRLKLDLVGGAFGMEMVVCGRAKKAR